MTEINLPHLSRLLSEKLGERIEITGCEKIGSGYHSDGFKLSATNGLCYFLKRVKSRDLGFELSERQVLSLMISHGMVQHSGLAPKSLGVVIAHKDAGVILPDMDDEAAVYHVQEFQPLGQSYWSLLQKRKAKREVDAEDLLELEKVTDVLCRLHKTTYPSQDPQRLKDVYNDHLRSLLTNPELTVMLLHDFPKDHPLLPPQEQSRYVGLMLQLIHMWKNRSDRLHALHGDFWGANVFFNPDGSVEVIDYSRIPWGDSGVDVAWWLAQYLWLFHETRNSTFQKLGEQFLAMYAKKAADDEVRQAVSLAMGVMGVVCISPRLHPELDFKVGRRFLDNVVEILQAGQFLWKV